MKRLSFLVLSILILTAHVSQADPPTHIWSKKVTGYSDLSPTAAAVDASGNVFVTGYFYNYIDLGGGILNATGGTNIFLAKYDANGTHQWSQRFGTFFIPPVNVDVACDESGGVILTGYSPYGTIDFGGGSLSPGMFLAKFDATGAHQWSKSFVATATSVAADHWGNIVVTGSFGSNVNFGSGTLVNIAYNDLFITKFNASGVNLWSKRYFTVDNDQGESVALDSAGNAIVAGSVGSSILIAKYDASGALQWSHTFQRSASSPTMSVAVDGYGNSFLEGTFAGNINFGGRGSLGSVGADDLFLAKFDPAGVHQWSERFGGTGPDWSKGVAVDAAGDAYITGYFSGSAAFGGRSLLSAGGEDIVLAKYDPSGAHVWSQNFGYTNDDEGRTLAVDNSGNVVMVGTFSGLLDLGGEDPLFSPIGTLAMFVTKFNSDAGSPINLLPSITSVTDIGNDQGGKVKLAFDRALDDQLASQTPVASYEVYRRDDPPPVSVAASRGLLGSSRKALLDSGWTIVGDLAAHQRSTYEIDVPTIGDSTIAHGQYYSVFFVRATTAAPGTFFDSPPDSGYSLDNLAPSAPSNLIYSGGQLSWNASSAADFKYFTVYGCTTNNFADASIVGFTTASARDVSGSPYTFYFVTATDFSGNESQPASATIATGVGDTPRTFVLSISNYPNPFNPATTITYTVPKPGLVTVAIFDTRGARITTLVDRVAVPAGTYTIDWHGQTDSGAAVSSGIYFARIEQAGVSRSKKIALLK